FFKSQLHRGKAKYLTSATRSPLNMFFGLFYPLLFELSALIPDPAFSQVTSSKYSTMEFPNTARATFDYDSHYWSDKNQYNIPGGRTGFDSQETKLPTYWNTPFSKICLGMKIKGQLRFIVINKQANSLHSLIADATYRATSLGRNEWKKLIGAQGSLQLNCNKEGFNAVVQFSSLISDIAFSQVTESNPVYRVGNLASSTRTFLKRTFIKHEFHHLNVPLVGTAAVSDVFDCTFECLSNPFCFSVNLAAFKEAHGKLWCELLSSDKFRNSTEYKGNKSSHHFAIESADVPGKQKMVKSNPVYREGNLASSTRTSLKRTFSKHEFHHLNVSLVGTVAVSDVFDCTLQCLSNPFCFSVNLAAFKGAHGILWCELLSSDKFRNSTEYKGNKSSHHFAIENQPPLAVSDVFDCTLECLSDPFCFSVNLAAFKGAHGKLWCELLSSDKFRNSTEYKENKSSHHFAIESPCSSSPCQHEATCVTDYRGGSFRCRCAEGFIGEYCEKGE
ncbi:hypothetical protein pdam_00024559, partial [Pocillopora damicornis]